MPSTTGIRIDDCKAQLANNILKLSTQNLLNVTEVLSSLHCPGLLGMIEQYGTLSCEKTSFLQALITTISAISGPIMVQNPIGVNSLPLNLFIHLIGEPGTQKSAIIRVIRHGMAQLDKLYPGVYSKSVRGQHCSMVIQSETELSLSKKMAKMGDIFAICDEIDALLTRLCVFSAGERAAAAGGKIVCQGFDLIEDETRGTGPNTHTIKLAKLAILGASTGEKYAANMLKFESGSGSDGVIARIGIHVMPTVLANTVASTSVLTSIPNVLHCLTIIHHLAAQKVQLQFEKGQADIDNQPDLIIPQWLQDLQQLHGINRSMVQVINGEETSLPVYVPTSAELEEDGTYVSAYGLICRSIQNDLKMANDFTDLKLYVRTLLRKTGVKLPRYCGCMNLLYHAISWCYEIFDKIDFVAGLHVGNRELDTEFLTAAEDLVKQKIEQMPKDSQDQPILIITKSVVIAATKLYEFTKQSCVEFFSCNGIERFATERLVKNAIVKETAQELQINKRQTTHNEKYVLVSMESPFILSSWLSTKTAGLSWSGKWNKNVADGQAVLNCLQESGLLIQGKFIMYSKNPSYAKLTPAAVEEDPEKVASLLSFGITIQQYQAAYENMILPVRTKLTLQGIEYLCDSKYLIPYYHLYSQNEIIKEIDRLVQNEKIKRIISNDGITRYVMSDTSENNVRRQSSSQDGDTISSYFDRERPAQAILHDLSNEETNENVDVASNQNRHNNCTATKRKSDTEKIDNKRRKTEGVHEQSPTTFD